MKILKLWLKDYRNHHDLIVDFKGESMLIKGFNGTGKTNILEAINLLSTTKSNRSRYDTDLIAHNKDLAGISANVLKDDEKLKLELYIERNAKRGNNSKKTAKINNTKKGLKNFAGMFNSVFFSPTDIQLITGSPSLRRKYLDSVLFQVDNQYRYDINDYQKAVKQRNKVLEKLRNGFVQIDQLDFWNSKILNLGENIQDTRKNLISHINQILNDTVSNLNGSDTKCKIKYKMNKITKERLNEYESAEITSKTTLIGPHRDDIQFIFNEFDLADFGSRGQQRTVVLGLKLCEIDFITQKATHRPVLLLDDIFSELDPLHKKAVNSIINKQQTIITTAYESFKDISFETL